MAYPTRIQPQSAELESDWREAQHYFKAREHVIFLSYCRFWEKHGFVQQSLARELVRLGVQVTWLDGEGWRPYRPTLHSNSPLLRVEQLFRFPGERFQWTRGLSHLSQKKKIGRLLKKFPSSVIWAQAGINDALAGSLPYVDVYSTFDDPYRHAPDGVLCNKAKVIVCQNSITLRRMRNVHREKSILCLPPVDMSEVQESIISPLELPATFPKKIMGYIGSFFSHDYDLVLFEKMVNTFPQYGFILAGRTDPAGLRVIKELERLSQFRHFAWVPRSQVSSLWRKLNLTLLLYRPFRAQEGAFPVKVLESLYFNVPCISTAVAKTEDLRGIFPQSSLPSELILLAEKMILSPPNLESAYRDLSIRMSPYFHLSEVAKRLRS